MFGNTRRTVQFILRIHKSRYLGVSRDGALASVAPNINQCRMYMQYKFPSEGCSSFMWRGSRENFHKGRSFWNLSAISTKNIAAHNPQTWKLLFKIYSSNGSNGFTSINMVAQAVSLALSRSCFLIPCIFAFACGELTLAQQNQSDAGCYPSQNALSMRAQDGYSYMFAFIFNVVESLVLLARAIYLTVLFSPRFFENFEEFPVASGSIAQAYSPSLKYCYPGQQAKPMVVAVKVRHPGVGGSIRRDFAIINFVAKSSNFIPALNWSRLDESV